MRDLVKARLIDAEPRRILVIIYQGLGDLVLSTPALKAIQARFPRTYLCVAGKPGLLDILANESYVDELLPLDFGCGAQPFSRLRAIARTVIRFRADSWDLLFNLTTPLTPRTFMACTILNHLCRSRRAVSARLGDCLCVWPAREAVRYRTLRHECHFKLQLLNPFLEEAPFARPKLDGAGSDRTALGATGLRSAVVGLAPGGARQSRQWPIEKFTECARLLVRDPRITLLLLGSEGDRPLTSRIAQATTGSVRDLTGQISVSELPRVIGSLSVLIANDSGLMHVAAAVGTPLVAILGAESPQRYAPLAPADRLRIFYRPFRCSPCLRATCSHRSCTAWIEPEVVACAAMQYLDRPIMPSRDIGHSGDDVGRTQHP